jgi:hypothetical protein
MKPPASKPFTAAGNKGDFFSTSDLPSTVFVSIEQCTLWISKIALTIFFCKIISAGYQTLTGIDRKGIH